MADKTRKELHKAFEQFGLKITAESNLHVVSSDKQTFEDAAPAYQNALGHSNFSHKLEYTPHETQRPRRNRQRNMSFGSTPLSAKTLRQT